MATLTADQNIVTYERIAQYDGLIKTYIGTEDAKSIKSLSVNSSTGVVSFFKTDDASGTAAYTITLPSTANFIEKFVMSGAGAATAGDFVTIASDGTLEDAGATIASTKITGLGTASAADIATTAIVESSTDNNLVSAAQVATFVASEISGLTGAMHFVGVITRQTGETDQQAIARVVTSPESGDVVVMSDNAKEYIYDGTAWREVGDEGEYVKKTTTIAGVDLEDNITKAELQTALDLGTAAYAATTDFEASGAVSTAIAALDADIDASGTAAHSGTFVVSGITEVDGVITAVDSVEVEPAGTAATAVSTAIAALDSATDDSGVTDAATDSLKLLSKVVLTDGKVSAIDSTTFTFATQAQIAGLFS